MNQEVRYVRNIIQSLQYLSDTEELSKGDVDELVEIICDEQTSWVTDGEGWKVLESLKNLIRILGLPIGEQDKDKV